MLARSTLRSKSSSLSLFTMSLLLSFQVGCLGSGNTESENEPAPPPAPTATPNPTPTPFTKQIGMPAKETTGMGTGVDYDGNVYVVGKTTGALGGSITGFTNLYVQKYNPSGVLQWTTKINGGVASNVSGADIAVHSTSTGVASIYVVGETDGDTPGNTRLGSQDAVVAKVNQAGTVSWVKQLGESSRNNRGYGVAVDASENVYITGSTSGNFAGGTSTGSYDYFLAKYDSSGNFLWVKTLGVAGSSSPSEGVVAHGSYVYVVGRTGGNLGGHTKSGLLNGFVTRHDASDGTLSASALLTAPSAGNSYTTFASVAVDSGTGEIYVVGVTDDQIGTDPKYGAEDAVLVKYSASLGQIYKKQYGAGSIGNGGTVISAEDVTVKSSGDIYISGRTSSALSGQTQTGTYDLCAMKLTLSGNLTWARQIGTAAGTVGNYAGGLSHDSSGNIYVTAPFNKGLDGNSLIGTSDAVVVKWASDGTKQ